MNTVNILKSIGVVCMSICVLCVCIIFILVKFNYVEFDENGDRIYHNNKIVETGKKEFTSKKPYKLTDKDENSIYDAGNGDKITINGKVYIKHYCSNGLSDYILWFDVTNLRFVNQYSLIEEL
jgi:hypothetical protein